MPDVVTGFLPSLKNSIHCCLTILLCQLNISWPAVRSVPSQCCVGPAQGHRARGRGARARIGSVGWGLFHAQLDFAQRPVGRPWEHKENAPDWQTSTQASFIYLRRVLQPLRAQDGQRGRRNGGGSPWVPCHLARPRPRGTTADFSGGPQNPARGDSPARPPPAPNRPRPGPGGMTRRPRPRPSHDQNGILTSITLI